MEIPQRFILRLFLFLIYINDVTTIADYFTVRMYVDDTHMTLTACSSSEVLHDMNMDLQFLQNWLIAYRLTLNDLKTEFMLAGSRLTCEHRRISGCHSDSRKYVCVRRLGEGK